MNGYKCFYNGKSIDVEAETSLEAQEKAAVIFKAKKSYKVSVNLCELDVGGETRKQIVHTPTE
jgi:hypothetical protein